MAGDPEAEAAAHLDREALVVLPLLLGAVDGGVAKGRDWAGQKSAEVKESGFRVPNNGRNLSQMNLDIMDMEQI